MLTMWKPIALSNSLKIFKTENWLMKFWTRWKRYYMKLRGFPKKGWRRYIESCLLYMNIPVHSNDVLDMILVFLGLEARYFSPQTSPLLYSYYQRLVTRKSAQQFQALVSSADHPSSKKESLSVCVGGVGGWSSGCRGI